MSIGDKKNGSGGQILVRELKIFNRLGLHARPAALFVKTASRFLADITLERGGSQVSGKSIMGLLTLEAGQGCVMKATADGPDAREALDELQKLVEQDKFFED